MDKYNFLSHQSNLLNYYFFKDGFTEADIEQIKQIASKLPFVDGNVSGSVVKDYRTSRIRWIHYDHETEAIHNKIFDLVKKTNENCYHFDITNFRDSLQFTEYQAPKEGSEKGGFYDWHMDLGTGERNCTRKLSMVIQLTDPTEYDGGNLEFMIHRNIITAPKDKGCVIFFPSFLTHRVTPVTRGTRNSLVCWFHGPPFK